MRAGEEVDGLAADRVVGEAGGRHVARVVQIPPVEDHGRGHPPPHLGEVRIAELAPLRVDGQRTLLAENWPSGIFSFP